MATVSYIDSVQPTLRSDYSREYWWYIEGQAFLWVYGSTSIPPFPLSTRQEVVSHSKSSCVSQTRRSNLLARVGKGVGRIQIIWPKECLALYKSFSILWTTSIAFTEKFTRYNILQRVSRISTQYPLIYLVSKNYSCVIGNNAIALISRVGVNKCFNALNGFNALFGMMSL